MKSKIKKIITNKYLKKFVLHFGCAIITLSWLAHNKKPLCDLDGNLSAIRSINQTNSEECRELIRDLACSLKHPLILSPKCPLETIWKGCMSREDILNLNRKNSSNKNELQNVVGTEYCVKKCASFAHEFNYMAYNEFTNSCICFSTPNNELTNLNDCDGDRNSFTVYAISFPSNINFKIKFKR